MKKAVAMMLVGALVLGFVGAAPKAEAGGHGWEVAGKVLAGLLVLDALTSPHCSPPVVYEQPVGYYPTPVYTPPVVYMPSVVYPTPVVYSRPVVLPRPVYCPPPRPVYVPRVPAYRAGFNSRSWQRGHHGR